jgi:hypothetical protein
MTKETTFELSTSYSIHYTNKNHVPIADVIESLKSLEKLIRRTPIFVETAYPGLEIIDVEVYVQTLEAGSLTEEFIIKYVFKGQQNFDKAKEVFQTMLEDNSSVKTVVAMAVGGLIVYGALSALGSSAPSTHLEAYNNTVINVGAETKLTGKDFEVILGAIKDKKQLAEQAIGAVKPAKSDPEAEIKIDGIPDLTMTKEAVAEVPNEYSPPLPLEKTESYEGVSVLIYASDRDKSESTWAGTVPQIVDRRIKFILGPEVSPAELHGHTRINANIVVTSQYDKVKRAYTAKSVTINSFTPFQLAK